MRLFYHLLLSQRTAGRSAILNDYGCALRSHVLRMAGASGGRPARLPDVVVGADNRQLVVPEIREFRLLDCQSKAIGDRTRICCDHGCAPVAAAAFRSASAVRPRRLQLSADGRYLRARPFGKPDASRVAEFRNLPRTLAADVFVDISSSTRTRPWRSARCSEALGSACCSALVPCAPLSCGCCRDGCRRDGLCLEGYWRC